METRSIRRVAPTRPVASSATLLYGVRTAAYLAGLDDFRRAGIEVEVATDDGSAGHHGFVTELLARRLENGERPARVVGCGPAPMLAALTRLVERHHIACDVSLENHMACGFGACFSCVAPIRQPDGTTDLRRVCVEGPVFAAESVDWSWARADLDDPQVRSRSSLRPRRCRPRSAYRRARVWARIRSRSRAACS